MTGTRRPWEHIEEGRPKQRKQPVQKVLKQGGGVSVGGGLPGRPEQSE